MISDSKTISTNHQVTKANSILQQRYTKRAIDTIKKNHTGEHDKMDSSPSDWPWWTALSSVLAHSHSPCWGPAWTSPRWPWLLPWGSFRRGLQWLACADAARRWASPSPAPCALPRALASPAPCSAASYLKI